MKLFRDVMPFENYILTESKIEGQDNGTLFLKGKYQQANRKNDNNRIYPESIFKSNFQNESQVKRIREKGMLGELEHPEDGITKLPRVSHAVIDLKWGDNLEVIGNSEVFNTPFGNILIELAKREAKFGVSSRGKGTSYTKDGIEIVNDDFILETFDFVYSPSTCGAYPMPEFVNKNKDNAQMESLKIIAKRDNKDLFYCEALLRIADEASAMKLNAKNKDFISRTKELSKKINEIESKDKSLFRICEGIRSLLYEGNMATMKKETIDLDVASRLLKSIMKEDNLPSKEPEKMEDEDELKDDEPEKPEDEKEPEKNGKSEEELNQLEQPAKKESKKRKTEKKLSRKKESDSENVPGANDDYSKLTQQEDDLENDDIDPPDEEPENEEEGLEDEDEKKISVTDEKPMESFSRKSLINRIRKYESLAENLVSKCDSLKKENKSLKNSNSILAIRYESAVEMLSSLVKFTEDAKAKKYIENVLAEYPGINRKILGACETMSQVKNYVEVYSEGLKRKQLEQNKFRKQEDIIPSKELSNIKENKEFFKKTFDREDKDVSILFAERIQSKNNWKK